MSPPPVSLRETARLERFDPVWKNLNAVFADVAPYYDRANWLATFGMMGPLERRFMRTIPLRARERVLDVCAGTNAIGIALLRREPTLDVQAYDRSPEMQAVGQQRAVAAGFRIESMIGDAHTLPFPDDHFDKVTLQFASRHLRVRRVFAEVHRVLKPGGSFHHCDMLRPTNRAVEFLYYMYLRPCVALTAFTFGSGRAALGCKGYFIDALRMFYSAGELSQVLAETGFSEITATPALAGTVGFHCAVKPIAAAPMPTR